MGKYAKVGLVLVSWVSVYIILMILVTPITYLFYDPDIKDVPLSALWPVCIMAVGVIGPLMYGVITPLVMATLEVFDPE